VLVADVMAARGLSFDTVFLAGMVEHGFPRHIMQDPFLMDWERRELSERLETVLPPKRDRGYQEEKFLFYLTVRAARRRLALLHQRVDDEGKDRVMSYYLYEVRRLLGERIRYERVGLSRLEVAGALPGELLDPSDRDAAALRRAFRLRLDEEASPGAAALQPRERLALAAAVLRDPRRPLLPMALRGEERRWLFRGLDEHDGVMRLDPQPEGSSLSITNRLLSPTRMEDYGRCPFLYFAKHVLKLEPLAEPVAELERRFIGTLYHNALFRFFTELRDEGRLPLRELHRDEALARLRRIVQEECVTFEREHPIGLPLLWELEQEAMLANLETLFDAEFDSTDGFAPAYFEASFGRPVPEDADQTISTERPLEVLLGEQLTLRFGGRIDRIDINAAEHQARIFDYKSGKPKSSRLDTGEQFQLPIYLMAVEDLLLKDYAVSESTLWFIGDRKGRKKLNRQDWEASKLAVLAAMRDYAQAISRGIFFPYPRPEHCRFCDFRAVCRKSPVSRLERKMTDKDAAWYVALKEGT